MEENEKRLLAAIESSDEQLFKSLIEIGVNLKALNDRGMNILHLAVEKSSWEIVNHLLKKDKSLVNEVVVFSKGESNDSVGYTALHFSARYRNLKVAELLLLCGAKIDATDSQLRTPLHIAAFYGNSEGVEALLDHSASVNAEDCKGKTAFMYAVECDNVNIVKLMLGKANEDICKSYSKAIIEIESEPRCIELMKYLLCNLNFPNMYDEMLIEFLKCSIEKKRVYLIVKLLSSVNISFSLDESLETPKYVATVYRANKTILKVVQLLMNYDYIVIKFVDLETTLHFAVFNSFDDIVDYCLQKGVNVDCRNIEGNSMLYMMCIKNNVNAVKKCISLGCNVNVKNASGDTALHAAVENVNPELVSLLEEAGCDLNARNDNLETPFELLLEKLYLFHRKNFYLSSDVIKSKQRNVMMVAKMFLKPGMDLTCDDNSNECVLHSAVKTGIVELVKLVVEYHPSLDHLDKRNGQTCLHVVAELNYVDAMKVLLEAGANPDIRDKFDNWPIAIAINGGCAKTVKLLVSYSNVNAYRDSYNITLMHLAAKKNNKDIINDLVYAGSDMHLKDENERSPMCYATDKKHEFLVGDCISQHLLNVGFDLNRGCHDSMKRCSCWFKFYRKKSSRFLVLKSRLLEYDMEPALLSLLRNGKTELQVYLDITKEAHRLKSSLIPDTNIPFKDVIWSGDKKLANYAFNEYVVRVFKDVDALKVEWPQYWFILHTKMMKGFVRRRLLNKCHVVFNSRVSTLRGLPNECIALILNHLETSQLHTILVSFPSVDTSEYDDLWFIQ